MIAEMTSPFSRRAVTSQLRCPSFLPFAPGKTDHGL